MSRLKSSWHGMRAVALKEMADHVSSARMRVLEWLIALTAIASLYAVLKQIKGLNATDAFVFLRLFTTAAEPLPSFASLVGLLVPLLAIGLGFDAVNGEYNRRTLSRILSQPLYRDALLIGKFLGALTTLVFCLTALWLLLMGAGLIALGVPPSGEELARAMLFLLVTIAYAGIWLAAASLFSTCFRSTATSALVSLGLWLFLTLLWPMLAGALADFIAPSDPGLRSLGQAGLDTMHWQQALQRLSPVHLFGESAMALLSPSARNLGPVLLSQLQGAVMGAPLPLMQSIAIVWPQITSLLAGVILLFTVNYVIFQRREIRA
jgi:ABC-2 type transport system permease protein